MKKLTAAILAALMLLSTNVALAKDYAQKFWDVPKTYWGFEYIADLAERGVIKGYEDGSFKPEATVSRSEWAKMMVDAAGLQANDNKVYFTDTQGHWANKYINAASNYLLAYTDGSYRPDQAATREDVTVAMVKLKGYNTSDVDYSYLNFRDNDSISNYAKGYVAVAIKNNLITGFEDNTFRGQDTLTRAEAATLMYRAFKLGNADKVTETSPKTEIKTDDSRKSDSDYVKQAEPKYQEPEEETKTPSKTENTKKDNTKNDDVVKEEPKDEEPEEIEEKPQPHYEITTLIDKRGIEKIIGDKVSTDIYTAPYKDGVVFTVNNCVLTLDDDKKCELIYDFDNIKVGDVLSEATFKIYGIAYDSYEDRILVSGYGDSNAIYELKDDTCTKIADNLKINPKARFFVLNSGDILAHDTYNIATFGDWYLLNGGDDYKTSVETSIYGATSMWDDGEYVIHAYNGYYPKKLIQKEDFSGNSEVLLSVDCDVMGIYKDSIAIVGRDQTVAVVNLKNNNSSEKYSMKIKDSKTINFETRETIIINVIDKSGTFILYDADNTAFRLAKFIAE